jgi:hypothetical protein
MVREGELEEEGLVDGGGSNSFEKPKSQILGVPWEVRSMF